MVTKGNKETGLGVRRLGTILIIDDDIDYACLLQVALLEAKVGNATQLIQDGCAAMAYLEEYADQAKPADILNEISLILLDLRMPKLGGLEVLAWIRNQLRFSTVPTVVFSGVEAGEEASRALELGADAFYVKPASYRDLVQTARGLHEHFLDGQPLAHAA